MMKKIILITMFSALILTACTSHYRVSDDIQHLSLSFTDPLWDGKRVPSGQQCRKFGGKQAGTPELNVRGIPAIADALVVEYSDRSWGPVGGHGKIGYHIEPDSEAVIVPSVPGHSYDLPAGFFLVAEHLAPYWDVAGAYLPPCSGAGGLGNSYYAIVKAIVKAKSELEKPLLVAEGKINMGRF